ncbi:hypothetical protein [Flavobacterium pectinovorum]|uniref:Lipoprotein n=1 Tax=Flavobacterium pectinovorum TaxID=29533 RepID=A0A502E3K8_9FLAO|nr:hypothetical protein [Flavobacterium pectinovorum]TPG31091.1 hypothetical protein EAH81_27125 [Flavobacterium pectinovorum]
MNIILKVSAIATLILALVSCKPSNEIDKESLNSFFSKTNWVDFNKKTLTKNNLGNYLKDKIDFYQREDFFNLMKNRDYNILYDDFYLVEIVNLKTERIMTRKIIALNCDNKITYLFFKNARECKAKGNFSEAQIDKYKYKKIVSGTSRDGDDYVIITKITGNKY